MLLYFHVIAEMLRFKAWMLEHLGPKHTGKILLLGSFTAASITALGYGDILLKYPWRHLGTLIAITGVLMFGCSTAFLFVVLQAVWQHF